MAEAASWRRLCAHADQDGEGMHWLAPGEQCPHAAAADAAYIEDMVRRARWAQQHNDGWPRGAWSAGEQVVVALLLNNQDALTAYGETVASARSRLAGELGTDDVDPWIEQARAALAQKLGA